MGGGASGLGANLGTAGTLGTGGTSPGDLDAGLGDMDAPEMSTGGMGQGGAGAGNAAGSGGSTAAYSAISKTSPLARIVSKMPRVAR